MEQNMPDQPFPKSAKEGIDRNGRLGNMHGSKLNTVLIQSD